MALKPTAALAEPDHDPSVSVNACMAAYCTVGASLSVYLLPARCDGATKFGADGAETVGGCVAAAAAAAGNWLAQDAAWLSDSLEQ